MASEKVETVIAGNYLEMEREEGESKSAKSKLSRLFWHGGSVYDAWFSCASNQVAQVLLTLPYSFSQLGMLSGILFQLFYGLMGSWTAYLSILYVEYRTRKEREKVDFRNHVIQWFEILDGLLRKHWRNIGLFFQLHFSSIWICNCTPGLQQMLRTLGCLEGNRPIFKNKSKHYPLDLKELIEECWDQGPLRDPPEDPSSGELFATCFVLPGQRDTSICRPLPASLATSQHRCRGQHHHRRRSPLISISSLEV